MLKQSHRLPQRPSPELQVCLIPLRSQPSTVSLPAESILKWGCFLVASEGKLMNKQAEGNQRRGQKVLQIIRSSRRAVLQGQCVFIPGALLKASQNKNEESGEGWRFPKEILPDLDSSFLWSIMSAGGSITLLPRLCFS